MALLPKVDFKLDRAHQTYQMVARHYRRDLDGLRFGLLVPDALDKSDRLALTLSLIDLLIGANASVRVYDPLDVIRDVLERQADPRVLLTSHLYEAAFSVDGLVIPEGWSRPVEFDVDRLTALMRQKIWFDGRTQGDPQLLIQLKCFVYSLGDPEPLPETRFASRVGISESPEWKRIRGLPVLGLPRNFPIPPLSANGNDFTSIVGTAHDARISKGTETYDERIAVILDCQGRTAEMNQVLASLEFQDYRQDLIELICAHQQGCSCPQKPLPSRDLIVRHVNGDGPADVFNRAIRAAESKNVVIFDCRAGEIPRQLTAAAVRVLKNSDKVLVLGSRQAEHLEIIDSTEQLKSCLFPFLAVDGTCLAFSQTLAATAGAFSGESRDRNSVLIEWAYRAFNAGCWFVPFPETCLPASSDAAGPLDTAFLEEYCPFGFREDTPGRSYRVPKVSIYIPAYNAALYIKEAVDSILAQDYSDLELCIVDDGSTDATSSILESTYSTEARVRWTRQENQGIAVASNTAIHMCRGAYIGLLDSDDVLLPHAVRALASHLDRTNVGYVYGSNDKINGNGHFLRRGYEWPVFSREKLLVSNIAHHFRMFRKRDWLRTSGHDSQLKNAVDYDMALKLSEITAIDHVPQVMYLYRIHGENTSVVDQKIQRVNHVKVMTRALARMGLSDDWEVAALSPGSYAAGVYRTKERTLDHEVHQRDSTATKIQRSLAATTS